MNQCTGVASVRDQCKGVTSVSGKATGGVETKEGIEPFIEIKSPRKSLSTWLSDTQDSTQDREHSMPNFKCVGQSSASQIAPIISPPIVILWRITRRCWVMLILVINVITEQFRGSTPVKIVNPIIFALLFTF